MLATRWAGRGRPTALTTASSTINSSMPKSKERTTDHAKSQYKQSSPVQPSPALYTSSRIPLHACACNCSTVTDVVSTPTQALRSRTETLRPIKRPEETYQVSSTACRDLGTLTYMYSIRPKEKNEPHDHSRGLAGSMSVRRPPTKSTLRYGSHTHGIPSRSSLAQNTSPSLNPKDIFNPSLPVTLLRAPLQQKGINKIGGRPDGAGGSSDESIRLSVGYAVVL